MRTTKHLAFVAIAASALALAGCGGGGSSSSMVTPPAAPAAPEPMEPTTPPAPTPVAVTLPSDGDSYLDAADLTLEDTTAPIMLATGESEDVGAYTLTCDAGPCEITIEGGDVTATGDVSAAYTTSAMATIEAAKMAAMSMDTLRAVGVSDALPGASVNGATVSVARKTSAAAAFKSAGYTVGEAPASAGADWAGATLTRRNIVTGVDSTDMITVYNDIEAPEAVAFGKVYGASPSHETAARARYFDTATNAAYDAATRTLTLPTGALSTAQAAFLDPTHFPKVRGTAWQYNDAEEPADEHPYSFDATFHGAEGTYTCAPATAGDDCTATVANDGMLTLGGGTWTFQARRTGRAVVTDVDHLTFGYWLQTPDTADNTGDYVYSASLIATGSQPFLWTATANNGIDTLAAGSADYSGTAAGLYAVKTVEDGKTTAANHGSFLADANLTAIFAGAATGNMLSGEITNFRGGDVDMAGWSVGLNRIAIAADAATTTNAVVEAGVAEAYMGATKSKTGSWTAGLYGSGADRAQPTGVAGTFNVAFDNANIAGAFGARKQ